MPAPRQGQRVNDEPGKMLNLLFFISFGNELKLYQQTAIFHLSAKAMPLLNPFSPVML